MKVQFLLLSVMLVGCALQPPTYKQTTSIDRYQYVVIENSESINSIGSTSAGTVFSRTANPAQLMEGVLLKKGLVKVPAASPQTAGRLLLAKYGISGKRNLAGGMGGYAQEVTISLIDAESLAQVFTCTAEGIGSTEADDIREAISRCLAGLD